MNTQASADEITIWRATRNVFIYARECDSKQIWKYAFQCFLLLFGAQTLDLIRTTCGQNYRWIVWWGDVNNVWNMRFFFIFFNELLSQTRRVFLPRLTVWSRAGSFWNVPSVFFPTRKISGTTDVINYKKWGKLCISPPHTCVQSVCAWRIQLRLGEELFLIWGWFCSAADSHICGKTFRPPIVVLM